MQHQDEHRGPIMRLFEVQAKPGCADILLKKFATTSAEVVKDEPGNSGYFFGRGIAKEEGMVLFVSLWESMEAVKDRFGDDWQKSFLPSGYEELIETHSIRHIDLSSGWHVSLAD